MNKDEKNLEYYKNNCEEDYIKTPISVLRYISELEKAINYTRCCETLPSKEEIESRAEQALFGFEEKSRKFDDDYYFGYCNGAEWMKTEMTK